MSVLYTINGQYPDKNFASHMTAEGLNFAKVGHGHSASNVNGLAQHLADKVSAEHSHQAVKILQGDNFSVTGDIQLQGQKNAVISISWNTVLIDFTKTRNRTGLKNANPTRQQNMELNGEKG